MIPRSSIAAVALMALLSLPAAGAPRWAELSDEQQRVLERWQSGWDEMPEAQDALRARWRGMTPEERQQARERWQRMTPEERDQARDSLRRMSPAERRDMMDRRERDLRDRSPGGRRGGGG